MEYKKYLISIHTKLLEITDCNPFIIKECRNQRIIGLADESKLKSTTDQVVQNDIFWNRIHQQSKCWEKLIDIFHDQCQNSVVELLEKGVRDDGEHNLYNFVSNLQPLNVQVAKKKNDEVVNYDNDGYTLDPDNIGLALIINITEFEEAKYDRKGSEQDVTYMKNLWTQMGYQVVTYDGPKYTAEDVGNIINEFLNIFRKKRTPESCVVFFGTHGEDGMLQMSSGPPLRLYEDFVFKFTDLEIFKVPKPKPLMFFFQACRYIPKDNAGLYQGQYEKLNGLEDTLICFATVQGEGANRHEKLGSFFVYTLTEVFMRNAYRMEIRQLLDEVRRNMINKIKYIEPNTQVSCYHAFKLDQLYFPLVYRLFDQK